MSDITKFILFADPGALFAGAVSISKVCPNTKTCETNLHGDTKFPKTYPLFCAQARNGVSFTGGHGNVDPPVCWFRRCAKIALTAARELCPGWLELICLLFYIHEAVVRRHSSVLEIAPRKWIVFTIFFFESRKQAERWRETCYCCFVCLWHQVQIYLSFSSCCCAF